MKLPKIGFASGPVLKTSAMLKDNKGRELWFYGFIIGQGGIGFLISRPAKEKAVPK